MKKRQTPIKGNDAGQTLAEALPECNVDLELFRQQGVALMTEHHALRDQLCAQGLHTQQALKSKPMRALYRSAWEQCPPALKMVIETAVQDARDRGMSLGEFRYYLLWDFWEGGMEKLTEEIVSFKTRCEESRTWKANAGQRKAAEAEKRAAELAEREAKRAAYLAMTPEELKARRAERREKRFRRAVARLQREAELGHIVNPMGRCVFCRKPLQDPASIAYGVGTDCMQTLIWIVGRENVEKWLHLCVGKTQAEVMDKRRVYITRKIAAQ